MEGKPLILERLFGRKANPIAAVYDAIVASARQPHFYENLGVPDTLDGRFDLIVLHLFLVLDRMKGEDEKFRQSLTDYFFMDMDRSLREIGVGDLTVGKKVRKMAEAFYGRINAYQNASEQGAEQWREALQRNVYGGTASAHVTSLVEWVEASRAKLAVQSAQDILQAKVEFA